MVIRWPVMNPRFRGQVRHRRGHVVRRSHPAQRYLRGVGVGVDAGVQLDRDPSGIHPGCTRLTVMPLAPSSLAQTFVIPTWAVFAAT